MNFIIRQIINPMLFPEIYANVLRNRLKLDPEKHAILKELSLFGLNPNFETFTECRQFLLNKNIDDINIVIITQAQFDGMDMKVIGSGNTTVVTLECLENFHEDIVDHAYSISKNSGSDYSIKNYWLTKAKMDFIYSLNFKPLPEEVPCSQV